MGSSRLGLRFPWREAAPGALGGLAAGTIAAIVLGPRLMWVATPHVPFPDAWTYRFSTVALLILALIGAGIATAGLLWRTERQWVNYFFIGSGVGILLLGTSYLALERVELTADAITYRSWWGFSQVELKFTELRCLREVNHPPRGWRYRNRQSLHYETNDGREGTLCTNVSRNFLFWWASIHMQMAARKHGVEFRRESEP